MQIGDTSRPHVMFSQRVVYNENYCRSESNHIPGVYRTTIYMLCYNFKQHGHFSCKFPHPYRRRQNQVNGRNVVGLIKVSIQLTQSKKYLKVINKHLILIDT